MGAAEFAATGGLHRPQRRGTSLLAMTVLMAVAVSSHPTPQPTSLPTASPSTHPSSSLALLPTLSPSTRHSSSRPTLIPTLSHSSSHPSSRPALLPTLSPFTGHSSSRPTLIPTLSHPSSRPALLPTLSPTTHPTSRPAPLSTTSPSTHPTSRPAATSTAPSSPQPSSHTAPRSPSPHPAPRPAARPAPRPSPRPAPRPTPRPTQRPAQRPAQRPGSPAVGLKGNSTMAAVKTASTSARPPTSKPHKVTTVSHATSSSFSTKAPNTTESDRLLGSSVVTSVSVVSDAGNGTKTYLSDPAGRPLRKPATASSVGSPAGLMAPDRYEFYTFDETGDLVRRHMTIDEIKSLLAGGDGEVGETPVATFYHGPVPAFSDPVPAAVSQSGHDPEDVLEDAVKGVQDVVNNVQNVLKSQLEATKNKLPAYIPAPKPPTEAAWSMILPGIMEAGLSHVNTKRRPPISTSTPKTTKKPALTTVVKKTAKPRPTTPTPAQSKEEITVTITQRPVSTTRASPLLSSHTKRPATTHSTFTTQQDIVGTVYTLVSSSPALYTPVALKHTSGNNASNPFEKTTVRSTISTPRPSTTPYRTTDAKPSGFTKPALSKPLATKPAYTKPYSTKPTKPSIEPIFVKRPPPPQLLQQQKPQHTLQHQEQPPTRHHPQHNHDSPQQSESMVKVVTIQRPSPTSTPLPPFVTFFPTEVASTVRHVTSTPPSTLFSETTTEKMRFSPGLGSSSTWPARPARPPITSQPTTTTTEIPTSTVTMAAEERQETAASNEQDTTADLGVDSRTTDDEATSIDKIISTTSFPATKATRPMAPVTPTFATTSTLQTTESTDLYSTSKTRTAATEEVYVEQTTHYSDILTKVPETAVSLHRTTSNPVEQTTRALPSEEYTTPILLKETTTDSVPTIWRRPTSTPSSSAETTLLDQDDIKLSDSKEDDKYNFNSLEAQDTSNEETTKLYLKISSSENHYPTSSIFPPEATHASNRISSEEVDTSEESTKDPPELSPTTTVLEVTTVPSLDSKVSSHTSHTTDQSPSSTEQKSSTAALEMTTLNTEEAESRTEQSSIELESGEDASTPQAEPVTVTAVPTRRTEVPVKERDSILTTSPASPSTPKSTSSPSTLQGSSMMELSKESSNIQALKVHAPEGKVPQQSAVGQSSPPLPTTAKPSLSTSAMIPTVKDKPDTNNKVNTIPGSNENKLIAAVVDEGSRDKTTPADRPAEQLWTRVPVVSLEMENQTDGSVKAAGLKHTPSTAVEDSVVLAPYHSPSAVELHAAPHEHLGLEAATINIDADVRSFVNLCNELAFQMWMSVKERSASTATRSIVMSPFAATSTLAMVFLGARGPTSGQMNDVLRLDDMVSFNPHQVMWNVTETLVHAKTPGIATSALVRELYSDKNKGKLLEFYKERAQQFYDGHVEEISFRMSGDLVRRKTNLLVKRQTRGRVQEYMRGTSLALRPPLAAFGANVFETDCTGASTEGRDGEMHFVVVPSSRQRRLVPVPAAVWRAGFLAGYDPALDATAVAFGNADVAVSTILVLPGQQGHVAPGDGLARLEQRLLESRGPSARWARLLRSLLPRPGLELQIPRFSHRSVLNMSDALQSMGLDELFSSEHADLRGLNGVANDLHLSDVVQLNTFSTCGERAVDSRHHVEFFPTLPLAVPGRRAARARRLRAQALVSEGEEPRIDLHPENIGRDRDHYYARLGDALEAAEANAQGPQDPQDPQGLTSSEEASLSEREGRTFQRIADFEDPDLMKVPLALRPRQARVPEAARLRFDRPFLFFVRHNPTGILLHMGRFNPRLLP